MQSVLREVLFSARQAVALMQLYTTLLLHTGLILPHVMFALLRWQTGFPYLEFAQTPLCLRREIRIRPVLNSATHNKGERDEI